MPPLWIEDVEWDNSNESKLFSKGIAYDEANELLYEEEHPNHVIRHDIGLLVYGRTVAGRYLVVVVEYIGRGIYRPVTGWQMSQREMRTYRGARGGGS